MTVPRVRRLPHAPLRFAYQLKLCPCAAVGKRLRGQCLAMSLLCRTAKLDQGTGKSKCTLLQVPRCVLVALEHRQDIARFESGTDAAPDRLGSVSDDDSHIYVERCRDAAKTCRKLVGRLLASHLGRGADRNIEYEVRGARCYLLGKHRGDHLSLGV